MGATAAEAKPLVVAGWRQQYHRRQWGEGTGKVITEGDKRRCGERRGVPTERTGEEVGGATRRGEDHKSTCKTTGGGRMGDNNISEGDKRRCNGKRGEVIRCAARGGKEDKNRDKATGGGWKVHIKFWKMGE